VQNKKAFSVFVPFVYQQNAAGNRRPKWAFRMSFLPWQARHNVDIMQLVGGKPPNPRAKKSADFFCPITTLSLCLRRPLRLRKRKNPNRLRGLGLKSFA
jgi:hypothetical protein